MDKVNHHLIMWGNEQEGINLMNFSRMYLAKTCVFNINFFLIGKLHQFCKNNLRKNQNFELVGVNKNLVKNDQSWMPCYWRNKI